MILFAFLGALPPGATSPDPGPIPQPLVLIVPLISVAITGWLSHSALPKLANSIIALVVLMTVAALWALFSNALVGGIVPDIVVIAAYCAALEAGPLSGLQGWLMVKLPSPLDVVLGPSSSVHVTGIYSFDDIPWSRPGVQPEPLDKREPQPPTPAA